jgi:hypothetical protein
VNVSNRHCPIARRLGEVRPLAAIEYIDREVLTGNITDVLEIGCVWAALVDVIEYTQVGCELLQILELVVRVALDLVGTVGGKKTAGGATVGVVGEVRLVKGPAVVGELRPPLSPSERSELVRPV